MPSLKVTTTTTTEVKLKPSLKTKLLAELKVYEELKRKLNEAQANLDLSRANVDKIFQETKEEKIEIEGRKVTLVAPVRKKFNKKKLLQWISAEQVQSCITETPGKEYIKITLPGEKEHDFGGDDE